jgi:hypothetical protein
MRNIFTDLKLQCIYPCTKVQRKSRNNQLHLWLYNEYSFSVVKTCKLLVGMQKESIISTGVKLSYRRIMETSGRVYLETIDFIVSFQTCTSDGQSVVGRITYFRITPLRGFSVIKRTWSLEFCRHGVQLTRSAFAIVMWARDDLLLGSTFIHEHTSILENSTKLTSHVYFKTIIYSYVICNIYIEKRGGTR